MKFLSNLIEKYKQTPLQARASAWYTLCNILQKGISFFVVPIYVRILTTAEYGAYSVFQSWRDVLIILATLNLHAGIYTKAMVDHDQDRDRYTSCMQGLSTLLTAVLFAVYIPASGMWNRLLQMETGTMLLLFAYYIFYPALTFWTVRQRVENKYVRMVTVTLVVSVLTPLISVLLLTFTPLREKAVIWGYLIVQSAVGVYFYFVQFFKGKCFYHKEYWSKALKFNIPLIPHYLSLIVLGQADRIMIQHYSGSDKAGIYNLAYQIAVLMQVVTNAIFSTLVPWSYEQLKNRTIGALKSATTKLCMLVAVMTFGVILVAPEAIAIIGTPEYQEAVWIVPAVAISVHFTFCYNLFSTVPFYYGATSYIMVASLVGAVLNIILNAIFIPMFGYIAAGYTTLVCYFAFMIMHYVFMKVTCRKELGGAAVYDNKLIFLSCLGLCVLGGVCMVLYQGWIARYVIVAAIGVTVIVMHKRIIGLLKSVKK